jgi:hypothetical protein
MVRGIRETQRFAAAYPPLLGRDRVITHITAPRARAPVEQRPRARERDELGDRFATKTLEWAASKGLLTNDALRTAAVNYALTAFFIHFRIPTEWDEAGVLWEERADLAAKYMLLVAAGDEGVFDRVLPGETPAQRWARLEVSSRFLQGALQGEGRHARPPRVAGAELLATIAAQWREIFDRYRRSCSTAAATSFRAGLSRFYAASLAEHRVDIAPPLPATAEAIAAVIKERFTSTPSIAARARALGNGALAGTIPAANELRMLVHLADVAPAVGAGLLFQAAALGAPAPRVTSRGVRLLDATAVLLDYHFRLSNDMSGFLESSSGDRDPKQNACTILVPRSTSGPARAVATVQALAACQRLRAWLDGEVRGQIERIVEAWPSMGTSLHRGVFIGRRVYEVGHYTTISRAQMSAIFDEADETLGDSHRRHRQGDRRRAHVETMLRGGAS